MRTVVFSLILLSLSAFLISLAAFANIKLQTPACDSAIVRALLKAQSSDQLQAVQNFAISLSKLDNGAASPNEVQENYKKVYPFLTSQEAGYLNRNCSIGLSE